MSVIIITVTRYGEPNHYVRATARLSSGSRERWIYREMASASWPQEDTATGLQTLHAALTQLLGALDRG